MSPALSHWICNCSDDNRMPAHAGHCPVCKVQRPETVACPRCHGRGIEHWHPHHDNSHTLCLCCNGARKVLSRSGARVGITTHANTNKRAPMQAVAPDFNCTSQPECGCSDLAQEDIC